MGAEKQSELRTERNRAAGTLGLDAPIITGETFMDYWLWRCRATQNDWSKHPFRQKDKLELEYYRGSAETL